MGDIDLPPHLDRSARRQASLPCKHGGLGLQCTLRTSHGAYWAAWADALHMLQLRRLQEAARFTTLLEGSTVGRSGGLAAAEEAGRTLEACGFRRPSWQALKNGLRPSREDYPDAGEAEAGEWKHGWQFFACSTLNTDFREHVVLPSLSATDAAMLRSASGSKAGFWLQI